MPWYSVIAAAWFTILVVRKLPWVKPLVERRVKPFGCEVCMSAWATLLWRLGDLRFGWPDTYRWLGGTAALAGGTFIALTAWAWLQMQVGWMDDPRASDYAPPPEYIP